MESIQPIRRTNYTEEEIELDVKEIFHSLHLTPHPHRGKQNEPMYVQHTFLKVCELLGEDPAQLAAQIAMNFHAFIA